MVKVADQIAMTCHPIAAGVHQTFKLDTLATMRSWAVINPLVHFIEFGAHCGSFSEVHPITLLIHTTKGSGTLGLLGLLAVDPVDSGF
jgi:hypothetical protein